MNKPSSSTIQIFSILSEKDAHYRFITWFCQDGQAVAEGESIAEIQTDKAILVIQAERAGLIYKMIEVGEVVSPGQAIASYDKKIMNSKKVPATHRISSVLKIESVKSNDAIINLNHTLVISRDLISENTRAKNAEIRFMKNQIEAIPSSVSVNFSSDNFQKLVEGHEILKGLMLPIFIWAFAESISLITERPKLISIAVDRKTYTSLLTVPTESPVEIFKNFSERLKALKRNHVLPEWISPQAYSVSDLTSYRINGFTPVLGTGQIATLGIAGDSLAKAPVLNFTLVYDHVKWTGAQAASVLTKFIEIIEKLHTQNDLQELYAKN